MLKVEFQKMKEQLMVDMDSVKKNVNENEQS
jgi:hypothetical protein